MKDVKSQATAVICEVVPSSASTNLLVKHEAPPFDNPDLRAPWPWRSIAGALSISSFVE
jgi:hypothetical protein